MAAEALLEVEELEVSYGGLKALQGVSLQVFPGEILAIVGSNGAGKSTLLCAISGILRPSKGKVSFKGRDVTRLPTHARVDLGIAHVPEGRRVFPEMTVMENLMVAAHNPRARSRWRSSLDFVLELFPVLARKKDQLAKTLSGGEQQMLAIGRGLMQQPELMLIDEMSLGLAPLVVRELYSVLKVIKGQGVSIVLVEQNIRKSLLESDRAYVLKSDQVTLYGPSRELLEHPSIKEAYFGIR